jgi:DNA-binding response OmpR family regulator
VSTTHTILIVEDDPAVAATFARMLRLSGYSVLTACDGETGLRQVADRRPDAAVVDLRMPTTDGLTFMLRLRAIEKRRRTPVAIVTGDYMLDDTVMRELTRLGATVYFKPLWLEDLLRIARSLVNGA